jgi:hypothetical protein
MKKLLLIVALALLPIKAGDVQTLKITGAASTVALSSTSKSVRWIQLVAPSGNGANVLYGDATTSSSVGSVLVPGSGQMLPPNGGGAGGYDLSQVSVYVANSDIVYVTWETF